MFTLDGRKNDTSAGLDLTRAVAAQMVCVGHAWNLLFEEGDRVKQTATYIPYIGVMLFFVLSGFVIAHTLYSKSSKSEEYGILDYSIERFSRIYSAYFPALFLIAALDWLLHQIGGPIAPSDTLDVFWRNLFMLENYPSGWGSSTFGSAGQLSTVAMEFHFYFFVGGIFFFCRGRNRIVSVAVALLMAAMPLVYFQEIPESGNNLFAIWLMGFAAYFICLSIVDIDGLTASVCGVVFVLAFRHYLSVRTIGDEYRLLAYIPFVVAFTCAAVVSQKTNILRRWHHLIRVASDCSYSLFLVHLTILKVVVFLCGESKVFAFFSSIIIANVAAYAFASVTEAHHKKMADYLKRKVSLKPIDVPVSASQSELA